MNKRQSDMVDWAIKNLKRWPHRLDYDYTVDDADPSEIGARFVHYEYRGEMMVLECRLSGFMVDSLHYFYRKRKQI